MANRVRRYATAACLTTAATSAVILGGKAAAGQLIWAATSAALGF